MRFADRRWKTSLLKRRAGEPAKVFELMEICGYKKTDKNISQEP